MKNVSWLCLFALLVLCGPNLYAAEEEEVDLDAEEQSRPGHPGGHPGNLPPGALLRRPDKTLNLVFDLLLDYRVGQDSFDFRPNHTFVLISAQVSDTVTFTGHISDDPLFFEMSWQVLPELTLKAGKLLVPFGSNEFHHLIGGRVDELSGFLPESWCDYGVGLSWTAVDAADWSLDVDFAAVNGFSGRDAPTIAAGSLADNNANKGIALRLRARFLSHYRLIASAYYDVWDADDTYNMVFYSLAAELNPGFVDLPVLDRIGIRGEWARGEVRLPGENTQRGILEFAYARSGFYTEIMGRVWEQYHLRFRCGRINPDNTITDEGDVWVFEPAVVIGSGRLSYVIAYQFTMQEGQGYQPDAPNDVLYGKFFLRY